MIPVFLFNGCTTKKQAKECNTFYAELFKSVWLLIQLPHYRCVLRTKAEPKGNSPIIHIPLLHGYWLPFQFGINYSLPLGNRIEIPLTSLTLKCTEG